MAGRPRRRIKLAEQAARDAELQASGVVVVRDEFPPPHRRPTRKQEEFWDACNSPGIEEVLFGGAIRGGKTQAAAKQLVSWAWEFGGTYAVIRKTYRELADSTQKAMINGDGNMPPAIPEALRPKGGYLAKHELVRLHNGAEILFRSAEEPYATIEKMKNVTLSGFMIDQVEELEGDAYFQLYQTLMGRTSNAKQECRSLLVANPAAEDHWVHKRFVDPLTKEPTTAYVHCTLYDNQQNLDPRYVKMLERRRETDKPWFDRFVLGKWGAFGGKRFPVWNPQIHVVEPFEIPGGWEIIEAIDFGWTNPTAVVWIAVDFEGRWWVIGEHYEKERPVSFHARAIKEQRERLVVSPSSVWLDPSAFSHRDQYESPAAEFFDYGIEVAKAQNDRLGGWNRIDELLHEEMPSDGLPRLRIFNTCTNLIRELPSLRIKEGTDDVEKINDHAADALRYAVMSRAPAPVREEPESLADHWEGYARTLVDRMRDREQVFLG